MSDLDIGIFFQNLIIEISRRQDQRGCWENEIKGDFRFRDHLLYQTYKWIKIRTPVSVIPVDATPGVTSSATVETISEEIIDDESGSGDGRTGFLSDEVDSELKFQEWDFGFGRKRRSLGHRTLFQFDKTKGLTLRPPLSAPSLPTFYPLTFFHYSGNYF